MAAIQGATTPPVVVPITGDMTGLQEAFNRSKKTMTAFEAEAKLSASKMSSKFEEMTEKLTGFSAKALLAGGVIAGVGIALKSAYDRGMQFAESLDRISDATGASAAQIDRLQRAANEAGVDADSMGQALMRANNLVIKAGMGSEDATRKLHSLGLTFEELKGMDAGERLQKVGEALGSISDPAERSAVAMEVFGRGGQKMLNMLGDLKDNLSAVDKEFMTSPGFINSAAAEIEEYGKSVERMHATFNRVSLLVAGAWAKMVNTITGNRPKVKEATEELTKGMIEQKARAEELMRLDDERAKKKAAHEESEKQFVSWQDSVKKKFGAQGDELQKDKEAGMDEVNRLGAQYTRKMKLVEEYEAAVGKGTQEAADRRLAIEEWYVTESKKIDDKQHDQEMKDQADLDAQMEKAREDQEAREKAAYEKKFKFIIENTAAEKAAIEQINDMRKYSAEYNERLMAEQDAAHATYMATREAREHDYELGLLKRKQDAEEKLTELTLDEEDRRAAAVAEMKLKYAQDDQAMEDESYAQWESGTRGKLDVSKKFFSNLSVLMQTKNKEMFEVGKAASIAETVISTIEGAQNAFTSLSKIPVVGPALGIAAAAAATLAGMARVQQIQSTQMGSGSVTPSVGGTSSGGVGVNGVGGQQIQPTNQINLTLYGDNFSGDQVRSMMSMINQQLANNASLNTQKSSSGYTA